jgi:hypothetical protein
MCRAAPSCSELGTDPANWSRTAPLPPPEFFDDSLERFVKAFSLAESGDVQGSLKILEKTRSDELRSWFVEHGQMSGWHHRVKGLGLPKPKKYEGLLEQNKSIAAFEPAVYMRDGYRCRYCMIRVIDVRALLQFENWVGSENFKVKGRSNQIRHGVALSFRATADHVLPVSHGGRTSLDNLVTACWNCNYGKYNALLEQMDVDDPRGRSLMPLSSWNGLM